MMNLSSEVIAAYRSRTIATAESLTGGGIGASLTSVPGSSAVYKGGIISYTDEIKHALLGVPKETLEKFGAVSAPVAEAMAEGARKALCVDAAVSVTGLAGPSGDDYGNPVGTVYIGFSNDEKTISMHFVFGGDREAVRSQTIEAALKLFLENK